MGCRQIEYRGLVTQQPDTQQPDGPQPDGTHSTARRQPRFAGFLFTGGIVGLLIGLFVSVIGPEDARYDTSVTLGFLGLICAALGVLAGGIIAALLDKRR